MKTFKEIYDFCNSESTFKKHSDLERFLQGQIRDYYFYVDRSSLQPVNPKKFLGDTIFIVSNIEKDGVEIYFTNPLQPDHYSKWLSFTARSQRQYIIQNIVEEVSDFIHKNILFSPGRYRDLQILYNVPKEQFVAWYIEFKKAEKLTAIFEHAKMLDMYGRKTFNVFEEYMPLRRNIYPISFLHINDLEEEDFDTKKISDNDMKSLAEKMNNDYCNWMFWDSLTAIANESGLPKREETTENQI